MSITLAPESTAVGGGWGQEGEEGVIGSKGGLRGGTKVVLLRPGRWEVVRSFSSSPALSFSSFTSFPLVIFFFFLSVPLPPSLPLWLLLPVWAGPCQGLCLSPSFDMPLIMVRWGNTTLCLSCSIFSLLSSSTLSSVRMSCCCKMEKIN